MSTIPYFLATSDQQRAEFVTRGLEQAQRDIINIQRQMDKPQGDPLPASSSPGGGGAIVGTLTSTLSRGGSATLSTGDTVHDNTTLPGTIALPVGTYVVAVQDNASGNFYVLPPPWCFRLRGTLPSGAIANTSTGTVALANSMGNITARNRKGESSPTGSKGCECQWEEGVTEWLVSDWNCA